MTSWESHWERREQNLKLALILVFFLLPPLDDTQMYKKKLLKKITFWLSSNWNFIFCLFLLIEWVESGVLRRPQTTTKKNWAWKFLRFSFPPRRHLLIIFKLILGVAERKKNYLSTAHILSSRRSKKKDCVWFLFDFNLWNSFWFSKRYSVEREKCRARVKQLIFLAVCDQRARIIYLRKFLISQIFLCLRKDKKKN